MKQLGEIRLNNRAAAMVVEIEGLIGVPEGWQFENDDERVATYERFRSVVQQIEDADPRSVTVHIRSIGGSVGDALLIYDALCVLSQRGVEVTTICHGYVASAATIIAQAASEGRRMVSSGTLYLIHNATTTLEGNSGDATRTADLLDKTDERIAAIYARRSSRPAEEFRELMGRDAGRGEWLSPDEVVAFGLADTVEAASPLVRLKERVRNLLGRSAAGVSNVVMALLEGPDLALAETEVEVSDNGVGQLVKQISDLEQQVNRLSDDNAMLRARPSATLPKEDPTIDTVTGYSASLGNKTAYQEDVMAFRN